MQQLMNCTRNPSWRAFISALQAPMYAARTIGGAGGPRPCLPATLLLMLLRVVGADALMHSILTTGRIENSVRKGEQCVINKTGQSMTTAHAWENKQCNGQGPAPPQPKGCAGQV